MDEYKVILNKLYEEETKQGKILQKLNELDEVYCEVPFSYKENDIIYTGVIDLIYKENDQWYIIDYKTNKENDINKLEEHYKGQLEIYKKAFKKITSNDSTAHIYHLEVK